MNYYPHHIGDYLRDTSHLSLMEHGAYRRMLDLYYASEKPLPLNLSGLYRLVQAKSKQEREAVDTILEEFFTRSEEGWRNARADIEIAKAQEKSGKAKASAAHRWHCDRNATAMRTHSEGNATPACEGNAPNNQEPITNSHSAAYADDFEEFWKSYPHRAGGNPKARAAKAYRARRREGVAADEMLEGAKRYAAFVRATGKEGTEYVKQAATFLGPDNHFREPWELPEANVSPLYRREGVM